MKIKRRSRLHHEYLEKTLSVADYCEGIPVIAKPNVRVRKEPMRIGKYHQFGDSALRFRRQAGFGLLGWLVMIPVGLIVLLILTIGFYEGRKAYWDSKIREMCAKDGDGKVLQTIELNKQEYDSLINKFGLFEIPLDGLVPKDAPIIQKQISTYIRRNNPEIRQDNMTIIRKSDGAILAMQTIYSRVGGDLITFHPSHYSCPENPIDIYSKVVIQAGEK